MTLQELFAVLANVQVLDASGTIEQLRERNVRRLRPLVDEADRAEQTLERMAREAAISRRVIRQPQVVKALEQDGAGPRLARFALSVDVDAYAEKLQSDSMAVDVAKLPSLVPNVDSGSGSPFQLDTVNGRTLLIGGHGAGKSRLAAELAVKSIRSGLACLHIHLARWATTLRDLLLAELSRASGKQARSRGLQSLFGEAGVLVLDGLDEVPATQRPTAEREILQFADTYPQNCDSRHYPTGFRTHIVGVLAYCLPSSAVSCAN